MDEPADVVVLGVAVHRGTGEVRQVSLCWRVADALVRIRTGGRLLCPVGRTADELAELTAFIFAAAGGGGEAEPVADPVNIDGRARNGLRDRLARRQLEVRDMAAD